MTKKSREMIKFRLLMNGPGQAKLEPKHLIKHGKIYRFLDTTDHTNGQQGRTTANRM